MLTPHIVQTPGERLLLALDRFLAEREAKLDGDAWIAGLGQMPANEQMPQLRANGLLLMLRVCTDVLNMVPPWTLRDTLRKLLDALPLGANGAPMQARARKALAQRWTRLLDLTTDQVSALLLREVIPHISTARRGAAVPNPAPNFFAELCRQLEQVDGDTPFQWGYHIYTFSPLRAKLIYLLMRDDSGKRANSFLWYDLDVCEILWGKRPADGSPQAQKLRNRLRVLQNATNKNLAKTGRIIIRPENNTLRLRAAR